MKTNNEKIFDKSIKLLFFLVDHISKKKYKKKNDTMLARGILIEFIVNKLL